MSAVLANPSQVFVNQGTGNMGIGTTAPAHRLHVFGSICYTSNLIAGSTQVFTGSTLNATALPNTGVTSATYGSASSVPVLAVDATGRITSASSTTILASQWTSSGNNIYYTSGNVGIATISPQHPLDVAGNIRANNFIGNASGLSNIRGSNIADGTVTFSKLDPSAYNFQWLNVVVPGGGLRTSQRVIIDGDLIVGGDLICQSNTNIYTSSGTVAGPIPEGSIATCNLANGAVTPPKVDFFNPGLPVIFGGTVGIGSTIPANNLDVVGSISYTGNLIAGSTQVFTGSTLNAAALPTTGVTAATYGSASSVPVLAVDATGRLTTVTNTSIAIASGAVSGLAASATTDTTNATNITSGTLPAAQLPTSGVGAGTYGSGSAVPVITVDTTGRITSASTSAITASQWTTTGNNIYYTTGSVGIGTATVLYPLHVQGNIYASGDITAFSDSNMKTDLMPITNALDKVSYLTGYTYTRRDDPSQKRMAGLLAQEVQKVLPEVVYQDSSKDNKGEGGLSLAYGNLIALLVEAVKDLRHRMDDLCQKNTKPSAGDV